MMVTELNMKTWRYNWSPPSADINAIDIRNHYLFSVKTRTVLYDKSPLLLNLITKFQISIFKFKMPIE